MNKFKALYVINKSAKKYKNMSEDMKRERSKALYSMKHHLINKWYKEFERAEIHYINNKKHIYFVKDDTGFHIPEDRFEHLDKIEIAEIKKLSNFTPEPINESKWSERESLEYIREKTGHNINNFLRDTAKANAKWGYIY